MSDFKSCLTILNLNLRFLRLDYVSMARPLIDILHEALQYIILALRFTFNFAVRSISHPSREAVGRRFLAGEVSKTNTLNFTVDFE